MDEKKTAIPSYLPDGSAEALEPEEGTGAGIIVAPEMIGQIITELMRPVMQTIGKMLENNTAALEQLSSAQSIQNDRLEALERQIRLQTPVTSKQVTYLNDAIRQRARALLNKKGIEDKKAITKLGGLIRKSVLSRYGISSVREIPKYEYSVALSQIEIWSDVLAVRDVIRDARERAEQTGECNIEKLSETIGRI